MSERILKSVELDSEKIKFDIKKEKQVYKIVGTHPNGFRSFSYATDKHRVCKSKDDIKNKFIMDNYLKILNK